jgi:Predicted membrane protein (DUF2306)
MVGKRLNRFGVTVMALMALFVVVYSLRYSATLADVWLGVDPRLRDVLTQVPVRALTHVLVGPIALLLGPTQFFPGLRAKYPQAHRWCGRAYVLACVVAGAGALATAPFASGGPIAGLGFAVLAALWVGTTFGAWRAAVRRNFRLHRLLMRFSYAMTFAAVTLRLQIPIGFALGYPSYSAMSVWLAYTSWVPNVMVVALHAIVEKFLRRSTSPAMDHPSVLHDLSRDEAVHGIRN